MSLSSDGSPVYINGLCDFSPSPVFFKAVCSTLIRYRCLTWTMVVLTNYSYLMLWLLYVTIGFCMLFDRSDVSQLTQGM